MGWLVLGTSGCTLEQLSSEWGEASGDQADLPLEVVDHFPRDGTVGIGSHIRPLVAFNRSLLPEELEDLGEAYAFDSESHTVYTGPLVPGFESGVLRVDLEGLHRDRSYRLDIPLPSQGPDFGLSSDFDTSLPAGLPFNMSTDLVVAEFGANPAHADMLQGLIEPGVWPLWVLMVEGWPVQTVGSDPIPADFNFAPARFAEELASPYLVHAQHGFVSRMPGVMIDSEGWFEHYQHGVFLPLWSGEDVIILYLQDLHASGRLRMLDGVPRMQDLELHGVVAANWLLSLANYGGAWAAAVDLMELDVDTNDNGLPDAASFCLRSSPSPITVNDISF